eukprot:8954373-Pyramimonas_sp.AAC.1
MGRGCLRIDRSCVALNGDGRGASNLYPRSSCYFSQTEAGARDAGAARLQRTDDLDHILQR